MLRLCGCELAPDDVDRLVALLDADVTLVAAEACAAIRWYREVGTPVDALDADVRDAVLHVLHHDSTPALAALRVALADDRC